MHICAHAQRRPFPAASSLAARHTASLPEVSIRTRDKNVPMTLDKCCWVQADLFIIRLVSLILFDCIQFVARTASDSTAKEGKVAVSTRKNYMQRFRWRSDNQPIGTYLLFVVIEFTVNSANKYCNCIQFLIFKNHRGVFVRFCDSCFYSFKMSSRCIRSDQKRR